MTNLAPVEEDDDVRLCNAPLDLDEELLLSHHDRRLRVDHHHEQVRIWAFGVEPTVIVGEKCYRIVTKNSDVVW